MRILACLGFAALKDAWLAKAAGKRNESGPMVIDWLSSVLFNVDFEKCRFGLDEYASGA